MKQISTGAGLLGLGVCMVATAFIATQRGSGEAFAQVTGTERRIVSAGVLPNASGITAYRIWSDNAIDLRNLAYSQIYGAANSTQQYMYLRTAIDSDGPSAGQVSPWRTFDNGTSGFRPITDVDMDGEVSSGDISNVLLDMGTRSADVPPPPIDCTINAPR